MKTLALVKDGERNDFESQTAAARWLAEQTSKPVEHIRAKFKKHRLHVYGYDVIYLGVETACARLRSKKQSNKAIDFVNDFLSGEQDAFIKSSIFRP